MKTLVLASAVAVGMIVGLSQVNAPTTLAYQTPAHNYYQNNWMKG